MNTKLSLSQLANDPSCMDDYDPNAMSVNQAREFIQQFLSPLSTSEKLGVMKCLGRVLATNIISPHNVPNHNNSAMDGFAFKFKEANKPLIIIGTAFAGQPFTGNINAGECIKIMTGAVIPDQVDTVVMQEHTKVANNLLSINKLPDQATNIRLAGEDIALGKTVLTKGHIIRPADLGLIASLGIGEVNVYPKLKVAFFSTGDELVGVGNPLNEGQVYDSNRYTIYAMLERLGVEITDLGIVPDKIELLENTLLKAARSNDVVITSGGVSVGEADFMKTLLAKYGEVLFWKINMKPGRPLAYGKVNIDAEYSAHYFGLPGNPVSTMVTFYQFVRDALLSLMGATPKSSPTFKVKCVDAIKKMTGRTEFQRGILFEENGELKVKTTGSQGSGVLSSMSKANCFIVLDESIGNCEKNTIVNVQPLEGLI